MVILPAHLRNVLLINAALAIILVCVLSWYAASVRANLRASLEERITAARTAFIAHAEELDRNRPTEAVASILKDCRARAEFDRTLDRLRTLSSEQLVTTQALFDACGDHFAAQRSVMTLLYDRMFGELDTLYHLEKATDSRGAYDELYGVWMRMRDVEQERSRLLWAHVEQQQRIIDALSSRASEEAIQAIMREAGETAALLTSYAAEADALRNDEMALWNARP